VPETAEKPDDSAITLKDPAFAALLAWLIPGLGHWYQGRRAKAVLFFVSILGLFLYGLWLSSSNLPCKTGPGKIGWGRAVYFCWNSEEHRPHFLAQIGIGLPALPALIQASQMNNHRKVFWGGLMAPPRPIQLRDSDPNYNQPTAHDLNSVLGRYFELATTLTMIAGLLNVLAIYDAFAGPVVIRPTKKDKDDGEDKTDEKDEKKDKESA
jgi:hypothetical protein